MVCPSTIGVTCIPAEKGTAVITCKLCSKPSVPGSPYCARCGKFRFGKYEHQSRLEAIKQAWNKARDGFVCEYTGIRLDETNTKDP